VVKKEESDSLDGGRNSEEKIIQSRENKLSFFIPFVGRLRAVFSREISQIGNDNRKRSTNDGCRNNKQFI